MVKLHFIGNIAFRVYGNDHRPAHFHVVAPDYQATVEIETLALFRGSIPARRDGVGRGQPGRDPRGMERP